MKNILLAFLFISCSSTNAPLKVDRTNKEICYVLYNLKTHKFLKLDNVKTCRDSYPAASTFKIPLAVMAFDTGVLKDENSELKWDGKKRVIEAWNKDHTATTWMHDSVVWFSQELTPKIGEKKIQKYLNGFHYGNKDLSSGLKYAWLTPAPFIDEPMSNSLRLNGREQALFLRDLWTHKLPAQKRSQELALKLLASEKSPKGYTLKGKTGSGMIGLHNELRLGWFVGFLQTPEADYVVVSNFVDKVKVANASPYGGREAKELLIQSLIQENLW